ncbi:MAG: secretin N-terminal domain-containing protein [Lacunisphaera sp.]|nr:secretin N-terminal domain-containing protein [Lacunisphaera sp.]
MSPPTHPYRWLFFLAATLSFGGPGLRICAQTPISPSVAISEEELVGPIKLRDVGLDQILELLERWTGKSLIRPQSLPAATVTLNLKDELPKAEAIRAIESLLNLNGIAVTPLGERMLKITPLNTAKSEAPDLIRGSTLELPPSGRVATKLFQLKFLRVAEFMPQITGLLNPNAGGASAIFDKANTVLITDSISNLQRIETLMQELDRPSLNGLEPKFYSLTYAKASEVVSKLRTILTGAQQNQLGSALSYNADDRTNQIVLFSDPEQHAIFDKLIARLDVRSGQDTRNEVIFLKHAAAKDVATILSQMVAGQNTAARSASQDVLRPASAVAPGAPPANSPSLTAPASPTAAVGSAASAESTNQFSGFLTILPEERSNSIVVSGTVDDIRLINEMVGKIDVLLAQVRIEVVIAEVSLSDNSSTGISELGLRVEGDKVVGLSASLPGLSVKEGVITRPDGKNSITGPWDLAGQITLAASPRKSSANILSVPNIITTHNREGKIFVGEQRPIISSYLNDSSGTAAGGVVAGGYRSTVSSKDIGIQLSVKPLIGTDGSVQLEIKQEVNDILGEIIIDGNSQPRIGRRATESFVSVKSGEVIVLGGLQRSSLSRNSSRLGPVPIIGDLLGARSREKTRTDLLFFLRPTVLTNSERDNTPALEQVAGFPKPQREDVRRALDGKPKAK